MGKCDIEINAKGSIVSHGFLDSHTHIEGVSDKILGVPLELSTIPFGVTEVVDAGCIKYNDNLINKSKIPLRVLVVVALKNNKVDLSVTKKLLDKYGKHAVGVKVYFDSLQSPLKLYDLKDICAFAKKEGKRVVVHTTNSPCKMSKIIDCLSKGDVIAHPYHGGKNSIEEQDYSAYKMAREKGIVIDSAFAGGVHTDFNVLHRAIKNGIFPDTVSSDITLLSWNTRGGNYGFTTCMSMLRLSGMKEEEILKSATVNSFRIYDETKCGILSVGDIANIAVVKWDKNRINLKDKNNNVLKSHRGYVCKLTVLNGRIVFRTRK